MGGPRNGPDFQNLQRNKRSLTLNLKHPEGLAILRRLVATADVLVENYRPAVKTRLGIDYEAMRAVNPRLIYASISGFGQDGPYRDRPGFDQIAQGMGGLMSITGQPGQGPMRVGIPIADLCPGIFCAQGVLLALLERGRTGMGQWVTTSLLAGAVFMLDFQASTWLNAHEVPRQAGNNHPTSIPTNVFNTADGYINIAATGQRIWERLCRAIGAETLLANPDYAMPEGRSLHRDALNADIERHLAGRTSAEWIARLNEAGVPCGEINSIDQVFADPQVSHLGMVQSVASPHYDPLRLVAQPIALSGQRGEVRMRPPERGEHTDELLSSLGYEAAGIAELRRKGIV